MKSLCGWTSICLFLPTAIQGIGARSARMSLLLVMAILFCSLSPLILGFFWWPSGSPEKCDCSPFHVIHVQWTVGILPPFQSHSHIWRANMAQDLRFGFHLLLHLPCRLHLPAGLFWDPQAWYGRGVLVCPAASCATRPLYLRIVPMAQDDGAVGRAVFGNRTWIRDIPVLRKHRNLIQTWRILPLPA